MSKVTMRETMTIDGQSNTTENDFEDWAEAKDCLGSVFHNFTNEQFYELKKGEPFYVTCGPLDKRIERKLELFEKHEDA